MIDRSIHSLAALLHHFPSASRPEELLIIGGTSQAGKSAMPVALARVKISCYPSVTAPEASAQLATCALAWLNYFDKPSRPGVALLKSSVFANLCAHGVVPVLPHPISPVTNKGDALPGPFFVTLGHHTLPAAEEIPKIGQQFYDWYQRHAAIRHTAASLAEFLG